MATNYELVRYGPELKNHVIELQAHLWSPSALLNAAYFEWKYERNPYLRNPPIYLAMDRGKVIGMRGFHGVQWEGGSPTQRFSGLYADDMVIVPQHRGRGLAPKIMTFAFEDLSQQSHGYVFNLSAGPATFRTSISMGWRSAGWMQPMRWRSWQTAVNSGVHRLLKRLPVVSRQLGGLRPAHEQSLLRPADLKCLRHLKMPTAVSVDSEPRCEAMAQLIERIEPHGRIRPVRDCKYFSWRFQNPLSRYLIIYWDETQLEGYLVLQEYTSEFAHHGVVNIVDWEASNAKVKARLLQFAVAIAEDKRLVIWSATLPAAEIRLLERNGFELLDHPAEIGPPALLIRPIRENMLNGIWMAAGLPLLDLASWDLSMLCSMLG